MSGAQPEGVRRRAPFSDNPEVGVRGQRTQQRILDAALEVFGERGYHRCSIDAITNVAGCSRISFYQYFSSKEDLFRHLGRQVAHEMRASADQLEPITGDGGGWSALRAWVDRYADMYDRYRPVFRVFPAAAENDTSLVEDSLRTYQRTGIKSHVQANVPTRVLGERLVLLEEALPRTLDDLTTLSAVAPQSFRRSDVLAAYTDVVHRTIFGVLPEVNVHDGPKKRVARIPFGPIMGAAFDGDNTTDGADAPTRLSLLDAARKVFVERGYHGTRVDDIAEAAGVSHGAFYRYFKNKDDIAQLLAASALSTVSATLTEMPDLRHEPWPSTATLRDWLRSYNRAQVDETGIIRVWADAGLEDDPRESAGVYDWGRRRMMHFLEPRGFGNADADGVVLLAFLDAFGVRERSSRELDAASYILQKGFLGRDAA